MGCLLEVRALRFVCVLLSVLAGCRFVFLLTREGNVMSIALLFCTTVRRAAGAAWLGKPRPPLVFIRVAAGHVWPRLRSVPGQGERGITCVAVAGDGPTQIQLRTGPDV